MTDIRKCLTGSTLKWIAIITMLIDHVGAVVLTRIVLYYQYAPQGSFSQESYKIVYGIMNVTRDIGRIAFPIFCFLLVEGFIHTKNVYKYMLRMVIFAVVAEVPFDLALSAQYVDWGYQNVMLTMLIGMLTMWGCSLIEKKDPDNLLIQYMGFGLCIAIGMLLAHFLKTDYAAKGVLSIATMYFLRRERNIQLLGGALTFLWEPWALLAFPILWLYNEQRGMKMKYFFYLFYPLHLLLLYLMCVALGIQWIAVVL